MTRKGVWDLQDVRDKYLQGYWANDTSFFSWGDSSYGGITHSVKKSSPTQIPGVYTSYGTSNYGGNAVREDGTLWVWGLNTDGQLGLNNRSNIYGPTQMGTDSDWAIATQGNTKRQGFIKGDGTLWMTGHNQNGRLGVNVPGPTTASFSSPIQIGGGGTWSFVNNTGNQSYGIKTDNTLWVWGVAYDGSSGKNVGSEVYETPVQIPGTNWSYIDGAENSTIATKSDNTLWVWGKNYYGQLGLNERGPAPQAKYRSSPTQLPGTDWSSNEYACAMQKEQVTGAIKTDGTLWTWGYNHTGALAQNTPMPQGYRSSPTQVGTDTTWAGVQMGGNDPSICGYKTDGSLWSWGYAGEGRLGQNDEVSRSSPTQIGTGTMWARVASVNTVGMYNNTNSIPASLI